MVDIQILRRKAMTFPEATEQPHFEKTSFRVKNKIFATYDDVKKRATLKLSESEQDLFCLVQKQSIFPVPNKWGKQGWTIFELPSTSEEVLADALISAYKNVAPKKLAELI